MSPIERTETKEATRSIRHAVRGTLGTQERSRLRHEIVNKRLVCLVLTIATATACASTSDDAERTPNPSSATSNGSANRAAGAETLSQASKPATSTALVTAPAPTVRPVTLCEIVPSAIPEAEVLTWLKLQPGEYMLPATCKDHSPEESEGELSTYQLSAEHPDNPAADPGSTIGFSVELTDRVIGEAVITAQEGSPGYPPWFSRERQAGFFDAQLFDFIDDRGRTFPAVGREGWVQIRLGILTSK